jgi:hypothetical protein
MNGPTIVRTLPSINTTDSVMYTLKHRPGHTCLSTLFLEGDGGRIPIGVANCEHNSMTQCEESVCVCVCVCVCVLGCVTQGGEIYTTG